MVVLKHYESTTKVLQPITLTILAQSTTTLQQLSLLEILINKGGFIMPSKKPIIHFNTDQWIIDKMKFIANENNRSLAKEMEHLCKQRIKEYEEKHGIISLDNFKEIEFDNIINTWCETFYEKILKQSEKSGKTPKELWNDYLTKTSDKKKNKVDFQMLQEYIEQQIAQNEK